MRYSRDKTINETVKRLLKDGWFVRSQNKHVTLKHESGKGTIVVPGSPSDGRSMQNWLHQVRRMEATI
jgi:predicted RNA binding protein YcfA (HicA-like mRNA interferase family)